VLLERPIIHAILKFSCIQLCERQKEYSRASTDGCSGVFKQPVGEVAETKSMMNPLGIYHGNGVDGFTARGSLRSTSIFRANLAPSMPVSITPSRQMSRTAM
jgi:hypothetical protein